MIRSVVQPVIRDVGLDKGIPFRTGGGVNWVDYWATLLSDIGYTHPMLPGLYLTYDGSNYTIASHSIDDYRETVSTIKYVNENTGLDTNSGDTEALAYKTLNKAMQVACDRIVLVYPTNYYTLQSTALTAKKEIVSPNGKSGIFKGVTGKIRTWVNDGGGMFHTISWVAATIALHDTLYSDANGVPLVLTAVANSVAVAATVNSYFHDTGTSILYVRCFDDRQPDIDIIIQIDVFYVNAPASAFKVHFEGIILYGGFKVTNGTNNLITATFNNCVIVHEYRAELNLMTFHGSCYVWIKDTIVTGCLNDCINYALGTIGLAYGVEENVTSYNAGVGSATSVNNASTLHDSCKILRVNGDYNNSEGPCVHDVNDSVSLNIACHAHDSVSIVVANKSAFAVSAGGGAETAKVYLYECITSGANTVGVENRTPGVAHIYAHGGIIHSVEAGTTLETF